MVALYVGLELNFTLLLRLLHLLEKLKLMLFANSPQKLNQEFFLLLLVLSLRERFFRLTAIELQDQLVSLWLSLDQVIVVDAEILF